MALPLVARCSLRRRRLLTLCEGGRGIVEELHRRLIRIGLDALAEGYGYALAGGYAIQAHRIVK